MSTNFQKNSKADWDIPKKEAPLPGKLLNTIIFAAALHMFRILSFIIVIIVFTISRIESFNQAIFRSER
jgi:hypothetical protein